MSLVKAQHKGISLVVFGLYEDHLKIIFRIHTGSIKKHQSLTE